MPLEDLYRYFEGDFREIAFKVHVHIVILCVLLGFHNVITFGRNEQDVFSPLKVFVAAGNKTYKSTPNNV